MSGIIFSESIYTMAFEHRDYITLAALFFISFYLWTLPIQENPLPFGEGDAVHQFAHAEYYASQNTATREMPWYIATWYAWENKKDFFAPINAPPFFVNVALMQIIGGDRFVGPHLYYAFVGNFVVVASVYFFMRKLYSYWHAALSGFMIIFSLQNGLSYLWGQRTILLAMSFIPLILYCYYRYTESYVQKKERKAYFYLLALFLALGSFIHPAMPFAGVSILGTYTLFLIIKHKKLPFSGKTMIVSIALYGIVFGPFIADYKNQGQSGLWYERMPVSSVGYFYKHPNPDENPIMYSYETLLGGYWTIPFVIIGLFALVYRRNASDLLLLSWFVGMYLILHSAIIGFNPHADRIVKGFHHVLFPIIVVGVLSIPSLIPVQQSIKRYLKYGCIGIFVSLVVLFNAQELYSVMKQAYPPLMRISPAQLETAQWIEKNIPEDAVVYSLGSLTYPKMRWLGVLSKRAMLPGMYLTWDKAENFTSQFPKQNKITHLLFDYSDYALMNNRQAVERLTEAEHALVQNSSLVYDQHNIKVYQYEQ